MSSQPLINRADGIHELPALLAKERITRCLFVLSKTMSQTPSVQQTLKDLKKHCELREVVVAEPNASVESVWGFHTEIAPFRPMMIVAIGGGSVIDTAKLLAIFLPQPTLTMKEITEATSAPDDCLPLVVAPSTAGSGSEATPFAVFYNGHEKYSLEDAKLIPRLAILDPVLTESLPPKQTAISGIDAVCQALESIWSRRATAESIEFARSALALLVPALVKTVKNPDRELRSAMLLGAYRAGQAIAITRTTAGHAFSYTLTTDYDIPHGQAVAVCIGALLPITLPELSEGTRRTLFDCFQVNSSSELEQKFRTLMEECGLERNLTELGLNNSQVLDQVIAGVNQQRLSNHPHQIQMERLRTQFASS